MQTNAHQTGRAHCDGALVHYARHCPEQTTLYRLVQDEARTLRPLQVAACTYRIAFGPRAGQKVLTVQGAMPRQTELKQTLCADINGNRVARCRALRGR